MDKHTKTATFVGGPLDGQTRHIDHEESVYRHEQPPVSDDIKIGEIPVGFFPPMHEYIYEEKPIGSGTFMLTEELH